jgi:anti-sigma factor RsiW/uncharacterized protein YdcH (DUF465 family)
MKSCSEIRENLSLYIDDELSADERSMLEKHIDACAACRRELDEIVRIVGLCRDMQEVELPENFRDELHKKLVDAAEENTAKSSVLRRIGYLKIFSSIAAGIVLIFLVNGIYRYGFFSPTKVNGATGSMNIKAEQAAKPESAKKGVQSSADMAATDGVNIQFGEAVGAEAGQISGAGLPAADRSASSDNRAVQSPTGTSVPADETALNRTASLIVLSDEPAAQVDGIKSIAVQSGGEEHPKAVLKSESMLTMSAAKPGDEIELTFSIPNKQYDAFTQSLSSSYGQANIQPGALVSEDLTETLKGFITQSNDLDTKIKKLEGSDSAANDDKIKELKTEKDRVQDEIESIRLNADFTIVTVIIKKK